MLVIHAQDGDGCTALRSSTKDQRAAEHEVVVPALRSRINRRWTLPVFGSTPDRSVPLDALHRSQASARFDLWSEPLCFRERTCSTWNVT